MVLFVFETICQWLPITVSFAKSHHSGCVDFEESETEDNLLVFFLLSIPSIAVFPSYHSARAGFQIFANF